MSRTGDGALAQKSTLEKQEEMEELNQQYVARLHEFQAALPRRLVAS